jgi:hypothetical protein
LGTTRAKRNARAARAAASLADALQQLGDAELGDDRLAGDRALAEQHLRPVPAGR